MSYTDKLEKIAQGRYPVSPFVKKFQQKFKYFGDLRNQVVHGFRLDNHHYLLASDYAVDQVKKSYELLTNPPLVWQQLLHTWFVIHETDLVLDVVQRMLQENISCLPVYDTSWNYRDFVSLRRLLSLCSTIQNESLATIGQCFDTTADEMIMFMEANASIYVLEWLFTKSIDPEKSLIAVFLTQTGEVDDPVVWIITPEDLPKLDEWIIL